MDRRRSFGDGSSISRLIQGCWQLSAGHGSAQLSRQQWIERLAASAMAGLTTFDCADIYTGVEELLSAVRRRVEERGGGLRTIEVHTKLVPDLAELAGLDRATVQRSIDRSLERLGVERLDLVQFHWWDLGVPGYVEAAGWLDELRQAGKIRHLGLTNFGVAACREILESGVAVASHQVQYSLLDRRPLRSLAPLCAQHGVALYAYGTLAGGLLTERWLHADTTAAPENRSQVKYRLIVEEVGGWPPVQGLLRTLLQIGDRHGVGVATVASRWVLDQPGVDAVIVGVSPRRQIEAEAFFDLELDADDRHRLEQALLVLPSPSGDVYELERDRGGRHGRIMKYDLRAE